MRPLWAPDDDEYGDDFDCDEGNASISGNGLRPKCRIKGLFEKLLENKDHFDCNEMNEYDFSHRDAWKMRENEAASNGHSDDGGEREHNLLVDMNEVVRFLLFKHTHSELVWLSQTAACYLESK